MTGTYRSAYGYGAAAAAASARWGVDALDDQLAQAATRGDILYVLTHNVGPFFWLRLRLRVGEEEVAPIYLVGDRGSVALHEEETAFAQILADAQPDVLENSAAIASVYAMLRCGIVADADAIPSILAGRWIEHAPPASSRRTSKGACSRSASAQRTRRASTSCASPSTRRLCTCRSRSSCGASRHCTKLVE